MKGCSDLLRWHEGIYQRVEIIAYHQLRIGLRDGRIEIKSLRQSGNIRRRPIDNCSDEPVEAYARLRRGIFGDSNL